MGAETQRNNADLLRAAGSGDRASFAVLVDRHHTTLIRFIHRFLGAVDVATAEDLAQDVYIKAWRACATFEPRAKVLTWLLQIASNTCLNHRRGQRHRRCVSLVESMEGPTASTTEPSAAQREDTAAVRAAVASLPDTQRAAIILRHFHDLPYADIADVLEVSVASVESLLFRARRRLRGSLVGVRKTQESPQGLPKWRAESV